MFGDPNAVAAAQTWAVLQAAQHARLRSFVVMPDYNNMCMCAIGVLGYSFDIEDWRYFELVSLHLA